MKCGAAQGLLESGIFIYVNESYFFLSHYKSNQTFNIAPLRVVKTNKRTKKSNRLQMLLTDLPPELLVEIVKHVQSLSALANLAGCCSVLKTLALSRLYRIGRRKALLYARRDGDGAVMMTLLEHGPNPNLSTLLLACKQGYTNVVKTLLSYDRLRNSLINFPLIEMGPGPIYQAAAKGHTEVVRALLAVDGVSPNVQRGLRLQTPLHGAVSYGNLEIVQLLLESGAEPDIKDVDRRTPFALAVGKALFRDGQCFEEIAELLLEWGANVNTSSSGRMSLLGLTICHGNYRLMRTMLEKGVDVSVMADALRLPIQIAILCCRKAMVSLLLEYGADPMVRDSDNYSTF